MDNNNNTSLQSPNILALTLDDVSKDGHDDTIILKNEQVIHIKSYDFQSREYAHLQQLRRDYIAYRTPKFDPVNGKVIPTKAVYKPPRAMTVLELLDTPDSEQPYLIEGLIPRGEFIGIVGKSGVNKSTFCRTLCLSVATLQSQFCGFDLKPIHGRSLYLFSEDGLNWLRKYLRKNANGIPHTEDQLTNMKIANMNEFDDGEALLSWFREELIMQSYDVIVLDSFSDLLNLFGAKLNDNSDVRKVLRKLDFFKNNGCNVIINHHVSDKALTIGGFQGATAFRQIVRTQLEITEKGNQRIISVEKNSYGEKHDPMVFNLTEDFLFERTNETMTREELSELVANPIHNSRRPVGKPKIAPCTIESVSEIFGTASTLTTAEILNKLQIMYPMSNSTAKRWIEDQIISGLMQKDGRGIYSIVKGSKFNSLYGNIEPITDPLVSCLNLDEIQCEPTHVLNAPFKHWDRTGVG